MIMLSKIESNDDAPDSSAAFRLEFTKSRHKTPHNFRQFAAKAVRATEDGFACEDGKKPAAAAKSKSDAEIVRKAFLDAYCRLAEGVDPTAGFDGALVRKIKVSAIREELRNRGFLKTEDDGKLSTAGRRQMHAAKTSALFRNFIEAEGLIWRTK